MEGNVLQVAALGRVFRPGMLYDVRTDNPVPTETLWNQDSVDKALKITPQPGTELSIDASDTIRSKALHLGVNADLKLSFLGGLVNVTGSAAYLHDRKSSEHVERVSLKYRVTTQLKQLGMEVLGRPEYPAVFDKNIATHVVTAVLYGGQAVFVFDRKLSAKEKRHEVKGNLEIIVNEIPGIEIGGGGSLEMNNDHKKESERFHCTFHGDFVPSRNPTNFKEAVRVYKELPSLLGPNDENSVPVMVWLYPLEKLDSRAKRTIREISSNLVDRVEDIFEELQSVEIRCNDLIDHKASSHFGLIRRKLVSLRRYVGSYRTLFQKRLMPVLPAIRGAGMDEAALAEIIHSNDSSPFNAHDLNNWLDFNKTQLDVLNTHISMMQGVRICNVPGEAEEVIMDPRNDYVVVYEVSIEHKEDQYLNLLKAFLYDQKLSLPAELPAFHQRENWCPKMIRNARRFNDFATANKESITFIICETVVPDGKVAEGATIRVYREASIIYEDFVPPCPPGGPDASQVDPNSVLIRFDRPKCGEDMVCAYEVSLKKLVSEDGDEELIRFDGVATKLTLGQLTPNTLYNCRVRSVSKVGHSHWSERSKAFKVQRKSPPGTTSTISSISEPCEKPSVVVIGPTGAGKSSLCNSLCGFHPMHSDRPFASSGCAKVCSHPVKAVCCSWLGTDGKFTIVDTPSIDPEGYDTELLEEIVEKLKWIKSVNVFIIVFNGQHPRLDQASIAMLKIFQKVLGVSFWRSAVIGFSRWSSSNHEAKQRDILGITKASFEKDWNSKISSEFGLSHEVPTLFFDSCYDYETDSETEDFRLEATKLCEIISTLPEYDCRNLDERGMISSVTRSLVFSMRCDKNMRASAKRFKKSLRFQDEDIILLTGGWDADNCSTAQVTTLYRESDARIKSFLLPDVELKTKRVRHQSAAINGTIMSLGGQLGFRGSSLSSVEIIDLHMNTSHYISSMSMARRLFAIGVIQNRVYVCGGYNIHDGGSYSCEYYDTDKNTWNTCTPMSIARVGHAGAVIDEIFYVTGGFVATQTSSLVQSYDAAVDRWTWHSDLNKTRREHGCVDLDRVIYVCGGCDASNSCERYDPRSDTWSKCAHMRQDRKEFALVANAGKLYAIGGRDSHGKELKCVEIYDPRQDCWIMLNDVIEPTHAMSAVVI